MKAPWSWLYYPVALVPKRVADRVYSWIGRNRYRWFVKKDCCKFE
jgi:predicted DCC family thiol-disulfide oxidoreductase YuxK